MFSENFEAICKKRKKSPSAAVLAIGRGKSTASDWKKNHTIPKEKELLELANLLDCEVADFFRTDGDYSFLEAPDGAEEQENQDIDDFVSIYNACSNRQRNQLMHFVYDFEDKVLNAKEDYC